MIDTGFEPGHQELQSCALPTELVDLKKKSKGF